MSERPGKNCKRRDQNKRRHRVGGGDSPLENQRTIGEVVGEEVEALGFRRPMTNENLGTVRIVALHPGASLNVRRDEVVEAAGVSESERTAENKLGACSQEQDREENIPSEPGTRISARVRSHGLLSE